MHVYGLLESPMEASQHMYEWCHIIHVGDYVRNKSFVSIYSELRT